MPSAALLGLLDTVTFPELLTVLIVGLVVLGPEKLPGMARQIGEWLARLKTMSSNLQREVRDVLDEPQLQSLKELGEFAASPRTKLAEYARNAVTDPEDHTDGDAPATSAPTLPPLSATGTDHPMLLHTPEIVDVQEIVGEEAATDDTVLDDTVLDDIAAQPTVDGAEPT